MQDLSTQVAHHFRRDTVVYKDVCIRLAMRVWNTRPVQASGAVQVQLRKGEKKERSQTRGDGGCPLLTKARGKGGGGGGRRRRGGGRAAEDCEKKNDTKNILYRGVVSTRVDYSPSSM